ncbi:MAG: flavodoxin-dependent (E)-4-hydroxy-3-methylbut-2-enyl-diphosphate synthase [Armatimonadota bacterium]|nr:flavodoxin-dependent (E)-4-hydroxy-3-methylbut-2-enyl-diphosphate synthase [Armatimonadota bacterium]
MEIGGGAPIAVQSMTVTDTRDVEGTLAQIYQLAAEGCEIVRLAVPDREAAQALAQIRPRSPIPIVADIHFDYRLALAALEAGVDKLRINPGNIGSRERTRIVARAAKERGVPIRVGANVGSLSKAILRRFGRPCAEALVSSALEDIQVLQDLDFHDIVVSVKASDVPMAIEAYTMISEQVDYPLHVGITEAGTAWAGGIKSAVGIGAILSRGIGDTIRVSLAADPVEEVRVAYEILKSLGLRTRGVQLVACPSCGRAEVDIIAIAQEVERRLARLNAPVKVAVMGCAVNGPGEARMADLGIACGRGMGLLFRGGKIIASLPEDRLVDALMEQVEALAREKAAGA